MADLTDLLKRYQETVPVNVEGLIRTAGAELQKNAELPGGISGQVLKSADGKYVISTAKTSIITDSDSRWLTN